MSGRSSNGKMLIAISVSKSDYRKLMEKAEEFDESISTIIEWLIEEHLDEL